MGCSASKVDAHDADEVDAKSRDFNPVAQLLAGAETLHRHRSKYIEILLAVLSFEDDAGSLLYASKS